MGYVEVNVNPHNNNVGDCVVRAIAMAEGKSWDDIFLDLMAKGFLEKRMIEGNEVWGSYLEEIGYRRYNIPDTCPACYRVSDFVRDNPRGTFVLGTGTHAIAVIDGNYFDTFDSGSRVPLVCWKKGE